MCPPLRNLLRGAKHGYGRPLQGEQFWVADFGSGSGVSRRAKDEQSFDLAVTRFDVGRRVWASGHRSGRRQCQQYPCKRPVVAPACASPNDCEVSETVSSRAGGVRQPL